MQFRVRFPSAGRVAVLVVLAASAAGAEEIHVTQKDKAFLPGEVKLAVGDAIVFHNDDPFTHNMFSRSEGNEFNLKLQKPGQDMSHRFQKAGTSVVRCAIHPKMKLKVTVGK